MSLSSSQTLAAAARTPEGAWRTALPALALVLAAVLVMYRATAAEMVAIWLRSNTFSHAFLVPPIVAWLIWRQHARLARLAPRPNAWALLPAAAAALLWLLGALAAVNAATELAFVGLLVLTVPAVLGLRVARVIAFPLAFAFFAVPLGDFLLPRLMQMTADFTVLALRLSGVPVYRDGLQFVIPSGNWSVVEACSGVRYLIASFMVGTLYAYLMYRSTRRRLVFTGFALLVPLVANWVRAYLIVMAGHLSDNRIATGVDHILYGWLFFGIVIFTLYFVGLRVREPEALRPEPEPDRDPARMPDALASAPAHAWASALAAAGLVMIAAAPLSIYTGLVQREPTAMPALQAPAAPAGWRASAQPVSNWHPQPPNPSAAIDAGFVREAAPAVGLHIAYYRGQDDARKLADLDAADVQGEDRRWARTGEGQRAVALDGASLHVRTASWHDIRDVGRGLEPEVTAWAFYWVGGRFTDDAASAKLRIALDRLLGRGDDAAEVVVYTPAPTAEAAGAALQAFLRAGLPGIEAQLRAARNAR